MMKFSGNSRFGMKILKEFPLSPAGYDQVAYKYKDADLEVEYSCFDESGKLHSGVLKFEFVIAVCIEYETNNQLGLPEHSGTLYGFETNVREGFKGYQIWFSNNHLITVACERVLIGNEVY